MQTATMLGGGGGAEQAWRNMQSDTRIQYCTCVCSLIWGWLQPNHKLS